MPKAARAAVLTAKVRLPFSKTAAIGYAERILKASKCRVGRICIYFVNDAMIRKLNKRYKKRDRATDVLAFETGDIVISAETAGKNAGYFGTTAGNELKLYMIHGILHLSGFDDTSPEKAKRMRRAEQEILRRL